MIQAMRDKRKLRHPAQRARLARSAITSCRLRGRAFAKSVGHHRDCGPSEPDQDADAALRREQLAATTGPTRALRSSPGWHWRGCRDRLFAPNHLTKLR